MVQNITSEKILNNKFYVCFINKKIALQDIVTEP